MRPGTEWQRNSEVSLNHLIKISDVLISYKEHILRAIIGCCYDLHNKNDNYLESNVNTLVLWAT